MHEAFPGVFLYVPGSHAVQVSPSAPVNPTTHLQSVSESERADELLLAGHNWHVALPMSDHVPGPHSLHVSIPVAPYNSEKSPPPHTEHSSLFVMLS